MERGTSVAPKTVDTDW